ERLAQLAQDRLAHHTQAFAIVGVVICYHVVSLLVEDSQKVQMPAQRVERGLEEKGWVVFEVTEAEIAAAAQQTTHPAGGVTVVDMRGADERSFADAAGVALTGQHR